MSAKRGGPIAACAAVIVVVAAAWVSWFVGGHALAGAARVVPAD